LPLEHQRYPKVDIRDVVGLATILVSVATRGGLPAALAGA